MDQGASIVFFMKLIVLWLYSFVIFSGSAYAASSYSFPQGQVELISETPSWSQQKDLRLGLHFKINPEWHIYWINSGDSGAAPKWTWTIQGAKLQAEHWPVPERIPYEGMINIGYEKETLFIFDLASSGNQEPMLASVKLEFLICKIECIPYFTNLDIEIPFSDQVPAKNSIFSRWLYPVQPPADFQWDILERQQNDLLTKLTLPQAKDIRNIEVYPFDGENFKPSVPVLDVAEDSYGVRLALQDVSKDSFAGSRFLLVLEHKDGAKEAFDISLQAKKGPVLAMVFLWALVGGLILNVMPCVFPVLSIKILSFLGPQQDRKKLRTSGIVYSLGVVLSFMALGGTLLILRAAGEKIGWGFQLQSPLIAAGIALLFFWLGLNFLGTYEIGQSLTYLGAKKTSSSHWGSFLTGVLATVVATPCTAPFMGAALGASLAMPTLSTLFVFFGLGLGMASPFLAISFFPPLLKLLPKPGQWMQTMKEFLAFPLFATVLWLLWVLSHQTQVDTLLFLLALFLLVSLWIWFSRGVRSERIKQALLLVGFLVSFAALAALPREKPQVETSSASVWKEFSAERVEADLKEGRSVFIDFTAAWCITCQVNKKVVLNTDEIQNLFKEHQVQIYKADWTDRNPLITQALARYGRSSLPLYVFYPAKSSEAVLLPEILTPNIVKELFINKEESK
ncbi:Thiol:disulfide interchange protein DsbD precursor [compost metagenome]